MGGITNPDKSGVDQVVEIFSKLGERMSQLAGTLIGGERKMLGIGRALLSSPKLLLLDEPAEGGWVGVIEEIAERLEALFLRARLNVAFGSPPVLADLAQRRRLSEVEQTSGPRKRMQPV